MSLFKKLLKSTSKLGKERDTKEVVESKFMPERKPPTDEFFMENFKKNGGKFLYCSDQKEVFLSFKNIIDENEDFGKEICCFDQNLKTMFQEFDLEFTRNGTTPFFLLRCEYLIANTGGLLISSNQIGEKKLFELPDSFIVLAKTSQLIDTINEGMRGINKKQQKIPTNITTIKTFKNNQESDFMSYGNTSKNLYLLLLEDL